MSLARDKERIVVVRTDIDGNILNYDVVEQPSRSVVPEKPASVNRLRSARQPTTLNLEEEQEEADDKDKENTDVVRVPSGRIRRDTAVETSPRQRRDTATPPRRHRDTIVETSPRRRRDTSTPPRQHRDTATPPRRYRDIALETSPRYRRDTAVRTPPRRYQDTVPSPRRYRDIVTETPSRERRDLTPPPRRHRDSVVETSPRRRRDTAIEKTPKRRRVRYVRPKSNVKIFSERVDWYAQSRIDTRNDDNMKMINNGSKMKAHLVKSRIDTRNEDTFEDDHRSTSRSQGSDEKFAESSTLRLDNYNEAFIKHKKREEILRRQKTPIQDFPVPRTPKPDHVHIDNQNPEFWEYKKRQKSVILPPIETRKLHWEKKARINQQNDDFIEHLRRERSIPLIYREKLKWSSQPNNYNEEYDENPYEGSRLRMSRQAPRWRSNSKLDPFNDSYNTSFYGKPTSVSGKRRWQARAKIDTGLVPESDEDEYYEDDSIA